MKRSSALYRRRANLLYDVCGSIREMVNVITAKTNNLKAYCFFERVYMYPSDIEKKKTGGANKAIAAKTVQMVSEFRMLFI